MWLLDTLSLHTVPVDMVLLLLRDLDYFILGEHRIGDEDDIFLFRLQASFKQTHLVYRSHNFLHLNEVSFFDESVTIDEESRKKIREKIFNGEQE